MKTTSIRLNGMEIPVSIRDVLVVGTGCAGYSAADRLYQYGVRDIAIVTDDRLAGTSRNTGSDKQTYYKLTLSGDTPDSVRDMAETYFAGQCMDGEHALCEAALHLGGTPDQQAHDGGAGKVCPVQEHPYPGPAYGHRDPEG